MKQGVKSKLLVFVSVVIAVVIVSGICHYFSKHLLVKEKIWLPDVPRIEKADWLHLSGTALTIPLAEFRKRFAEKATLVLTKNGTLYYITKDSDLTFASVKKPKRWLLKEIVETGITGDQMRLLYERRAGGIVLTVIFTFLIGGGTLFISKEIVSR